MCPALAPKAPATLTNLWQKHLVMHTILKWFEIEGSKFWLTIEEEWEHRLKCELS